MSKMLYGESDFFVVEDERGYADGAIMIPRGEDVEVFKNEYDADKNIHYVNFKFWNDIASKVEHCLYEINWNTHLLTSYSKDADFFWEPESVQRLSFYG